MGEQLAALTRHYLLPLLYESAAICVQRHRLGLGHGADNFSFYTDIWSFPAKSFKDAASQGRIPFTLSQAQGCVLKIDGYEIRHHRVGSAESDNIAMCFPHNATALHYSVRRKRQLSLDFGTDFMLNSPETVVLAYMANPDEGLCAAYLAVPGEIVQGRIVEWEETVELWRKDSLFHPLPTLPADTVRETTAH